MCCLGASSRQNCHLFYIRHFGRVLLLVQFQADEHHQCGVKTRYRMEWKLDFEIVSSLDRLQSIVMAQPVPVARCVVMAVGD